MVNRGAVRSVSRSAFPLGWGTAVTLLVPFRRAPGRPRRSCAGRLPRPRPGEVHQAELADLHLVAAGQRGDVDRLAVDVGAVQAADVVHGEAAALAVELHVSAAGGPRLGEKGAVGGAA